MHTDLAHHLATSLLSLFSRIMSFCKDTCLYPLIAVIFTKTKKKTK